jgi:hypothetical protein
MWRDFLLTRASAPTAYILCLRSVTFGFCPLERNTVAVAGSRRRNGVLSGHLLCLA